MIVEAILRTKGNDVVTLHETASLGDASRTLDEHGIGAVVVVDRQARPVAVLSERDIVREVALHGAAALDRPVSEAMTSAFVTARVDTGLKSGWQASKAAYQ